MVEFVCVISVLSCTFCFWFMSSLPLWYIAVAVWLIHYFNELNTPISRMEVHLFTHTPHTDNPTVHQNSILSNKSHGYEASPISLSFHVVLFELSKRLFTSSTVYLLGSTML